MRGGELIRVSTVDDVVGKGRDGLGLCVSELLFRLSCDVTW